MYGRVDTSNTSLTKLKYDAIKTNNEHPRNRKNSTKRTLILFFSNFIEFIIRSRAKNLKFICTKKKKNKMKKKKTGMKKIKDKIASVKKRKKKKKKKETKTKPIQKQSNESRCSPTLPLSLSTTPLPPNIQNPKQQLLANNSYTVISSINKTA